MDVPADDAKDGHHGRREESIDAIEEIHAVFDREITHHPGETTERRREREKERRITIRDDDDSDDDSDDSDDDERTTTTTTTTTTSEEEKRPTGRVEESGPFEQV